MLEVVWWLSNIPEEEDGPSHRRRKMNSGFAELASPRMNFRPMAVQPKNRGTKEGRAKKLCGDRSGGKRGDVASPEVRKIR
jgi:hypothetical protein